MYNYSSPYNDKVHHTPGSWNPHHDSTVSIVYPEGQMVTPWPWLTASMGASLLIAAISLKRTPSVNSQRSFLFSRAIAVISIAYSSIRTLFLAIMYIRGGTTGNIPANSGIALLLMSCLVSLFSDYTWLLLGPVFFGLLLTDISVIFLLLTLRNYFGYAKGHWYGRLVMYGGTCPQNTSCSPGAPTTNISFAGCLPANTPYTGQSLTNSTVSGSTVAAGAENVIGIVTNIISGMLVAYMALVLLCMPLRLLRNPRDRLTKVGIWPRGEGVRVKHYFWKSFGEEWRNVDVVVDGGPNGIGQAWKQTQEQRVRDLYGEEYLVAQQERERQQLFANHGIQLAQRQGLLERYEEQPQEESKQPAYTEYPAPASPPPEAPAPVTKARPKLQRYFSPGIFGVMLVVTAVSLLFNIIGQQLSNTHYFLDAAGPQTAITPPNATLYPPTFATGVGNVTLYNKTWVETPDAWVDCFAVTSPADKLGFWNIWIGQEANTALRFMSLL